MRLARLALSLLCPAVLVLAVRAQSVHWDPPGGSLPVGQTTALRLVFDECEPNGQPVVPKVNDLTMQYAGNAISTSITNGSMSRSDTLTYAIALTKNHAVDVPSFQVETSKGAMRVPAAHFTAGTATVGRTNTPLEAAATAKLVVTPSTVWAGEVFDLAATVEANRSYYPQFTRGFDWTPDPLIAEAWSEPQQVDFTSGNEPHTGFTYRARALARSAGRYNLNAATHIVSLSVGVSGFGFFQQRQYDQYSITSNTPALEIKALPAAPAGFSGAVGQFKLGSKIVPEKAAVGEPITWTVELSGTGNWPDIAGLPARDVSNDFQVVQPKARRTPTEGKIFDVTLTEDVVLVPTKPGTYTLGPLNFSYFDPKSGTYKTLTAPRTTVTIAAPAAPLFSINLNKPATAAAPTETVSETPAAPRPPVTSPPPPAGIPRDPLPGSGDAPVPMTTRELRNWLLLPVAVLFAFWVWLALRQARRTDPLRSRREARTRIAATLAQLRTAGPAEQPARLLDWQHDAAILWQISHAAPPATALKDAAWATLWIEADRALYGAKTALPSDWVARAEAALVAQRLPGFQPLRLFLPRNLFPFAAALAFLLLAPRSPLLAAEDPQIAYGSGNFSAAEKAWRDQVAKNPADWIARHNLSLALAQQERAGEAAGHAAAAFVQQPGNPSVRWHFALASEKAGFAPEPLAGFLSHALPNELAQHHSPAQWQFLLIAAAFAIALALAWILGNAYGRRSRLAAISAIILLGLSLAGAATAAGGLLLYGVTADARAVLVTRAGTLRSIPTEADTTQKTTPLAAGSIAVADKTFLGWTHLTFSNGQTGWVRQEELVGLWK